MSISMTVLDAWVLQVWTHAPCVPTDKMEGGMEEEPEEKNKDFRGKIWIFGKKVLIFRV